MTDSGSLTGREDVEALDDLQHYMEATSRLRNEVARLEARLAEVERERDDLRQKRDNVGVLAVEEAIGRSKAEARVVELTEAIASAMTSLATGPAKDDYAYSVLSATLATSEQAR